VFKRDKHRGWHQLFDILNQAKAYGYLKREGCQDIAFIPRSTIDGQQTPDLKATGTEGPVLCEVETLNVSKDEIDRIKTGGVGETQTILNDAFLNKLTATLSAAERQMGTYFPGEARRIAYVIVNFDDRLHEYGDNYQRQIDDLMKLRQGSIEAVFDIKSAFYTALGDEA
jgi:hypothetical protein